MEILVHLVSREPQELQDLLEVQVVRECLEQVEIREQLVLQGRMVPPVQRDLRELLVHQVRREAQVLLELQGPLEAQELLELKDHKGLLVLLDQLGALVTQASQVYQDQMGV